MSTTKGKNKQVAVEEEPSLVNVTEPNELLRQWLKFDKPRNVKLAQMTKRGTYRTVTEEGKKTIEDQIIKMGGGNFDKGLDYSEPFLLQELSPEEKMNRNDKHNEYLILGGNHRFEVFFKHDIEEWPCLILKSNIDGVAMSDEVREVLAGANNAKAQDGTAKASWFEYFEKLLRYLDMPGVRTKAKGKKAAVNWEHPQSALVVSNALAATSLEQPIGSISEPATPSKKGFLPNAFDEPLLPITPNVRGGSTPLPTAPAQQSTPQMSPTTRRLLQQEDEEEDDE